MIDPDTNEERRAWAFVMALCWSRHQYVEFVFDQKIESWLRCHRNAFAFFSGLPERVRIDNLKAGIVRACMDEPEAQQSYRECAEHYDFLITCVGRKHHLSQTIVFPLRRGGWIRTWDLRVMSSNPIPNALDRQTKLS